MPKECVTSEVINKLCKGCLEKYNGSVAASFMLRTVSGALKRMKWQQYSDKAVFSTNVRTHNVQEVLKLTIVSIVTIISYEVYKTLEPRPNVLKETACNRTWDGHEDFGGISILMRRKRMWLQ